MSRYQIRHEHVMVAILEEGRVMIKGRLEEQAAKIVTEVFAELQQRIKVNVAQLPGFSGGVEVVLQFDGGA